MKTIKILLSVLLLSGCLLCISGQAEIHVVQRGETFESIAMKYGLSQQQLLEANPRSKICYAGLKLQIPQPKPAEQNYSVNEQSPAPSVASSSVQTKSAQANAKTVTPTSSPTSAYTKSNEKPRHKQRKSPKQVVSNPSWALNGVPTLKSVSKAYEPFGGFHDGVAVVQNSTDRTSNPPLYGVINSSGELIVPYKYKKISDFHNGTAIVTTTDSKMGTINTAGRIILPAEYSEITRSEDAPEVYILKKDGLSGVYYNGAIAVPVSQISVDVKNFPFIKADKTYNLLTGDEFETGGYQLNNYYYFSQDLIFDLDGEPIDVNAKRISKHGIAPFKDKTSGRYGFKNMGTGEIVVAPIYSNIGTEIWVDDLMSAQRADTRSYVIVTSDGQEKQLDSTKNIDFLNLPGNGYLYASTEVNGESLFALFNTKLEKILDFKYVFINPIRWIEDAAWFSIYDGDKSGSYNADLRRFFPGYIDRENVSEGIACLYDSNRPDKSHYYLDIATLKQIGDYYSDAQPFNEGLARVNNKQFIDRTGRVVLDCRNFDEVGNMVSEGVIPVKHVRENPFVITYGYIYSPVSGNEFAYNQKVASGATIHNWLSEADGYKDRKQYGKAKELYYRVMVNAPSNIYAVACYGYCLYYLGHKDEALKAYALALDIQPDNEEIKRNYNIIRNDIENSNQRQIASQQEANRSNGTIWQALGNFTNLFAQALGGNSSLVGAMSAFGTYNTPNTNTGTSTPTKNEKGQTQWTQQLANGGVIHWTMNPDGSSQSTSVMPCLWCHGKRSCSICYGQGSYRGYICKSCGGSRICQNCHGEGKSTYVTYANGEDAICYGPNGRITTSADSRSSSSSSSSRSSSSGSSSSKSLKGSCSRCHGTGVSPTPNSGGSKSSWVAYYNTEGSSCPYCNRLDSHYHDRCSSCNIPR